MRDQDVQCAHCSGAPRLTTGREIYPHRPDLFDKRFWKCGECGAFVGCHPNTTRPLGSMADSELRAVRKKTHEMFDPLWMDGPAKRFKSRSKAYLWLCDYTGLDPQECHIGMFDLEMCKFVQAACRELDPKAGSIHRALTSTRKRK